MKSVLAFCFWGCFALCNYAQDSLNMRMIGQWDDNTLPLRAGGAYSDIWGYTDGNGNEYAIIGSIEKIHFFNITNPSNPVLIDEFAGGNQSIWRDIKTFSHYAYAVADEGTEGLMIFDLQYLPDSVVLVNQTNTHFNRCHNIFIDEEYNRLYVTGSNANPSGLLIFNLVVPGAPSLIAAPQMTGGYSHDLFVRNDTAYLSHGNTGLYIYKMSSPASPTLLGTLTTYPEKGYNHSSWLTKDGDHLVFCDETKGKGVKIADVSDLTDITVTTSNIFRSTLLAPLHTNSVAHNPFVKGDTVFISYYHDGVQVFDISNPDNVVRVAYYDTEPNNTDYLGWYGSWGVYPYLPSGRIIASDILHGLIIMEFYAAPLPVEWLSFEGELAEGEVLLHWSTATETNNAYFEIERSTDGMEFSPIGRVEGALESTTTREYQFRDRNPLPGLNYYRLRQVDLDGQAGFSKILSVENKEIGHISLKNNILQTGQPLFLERRGEVNGLGVIQLNVANAEGGLMHSLSWTADHPVIEISTEGFSPGTYYLLLEGGGKQESLPFVLVR